VFAKTVGAMLLAGGLSACELALQSEQPLLQAGREAPQAGLWAFMRGSCSPPASGAVETWPECAAPVWLKGDIATFFMERPVRADFLISDGDLKIVRVGMRSPDDGAGASDGYTYAVVEPEGRSPFAKARVWAIGCSHVDQPDGAVSDDDDPCGAETEQALRMASALARKEEPTWTAVLVSPAPQR